MPIIRSLSNSELMMINSNKLDKNLTRKQQVSKSGMIDPQSTDGSHRSDKKIITSQLHKKKGTTVSGTITIRNVMKFMLGVSLLTGVDLLFRNSVNAKCIDIVSSENVGPDYEAMRFSPLLFNETQSPTYPTVMNEKQGHKIIKRNANHPYRYYYTENQDEKCKTSELQGKCKKAHVRVHEKGKYFTSLILKVGKTDCFCPPPDNHRVEIIELKNHSHGYYYSENQDKRCNSRELLERCQATHVREHEKGKHFTLLILKVGKIDCSCPPPENKNVERVEPSFDGYINGAHVNDNYVNMDVIEIKNNTTTHSYFFLKEAKSHLLLLIRQNLNQKVKRHTLMT